MTSASSRKRLEKVGGEQYGLLRDLTNERAWDTATLEAAVVHIVQDRFDMARGFLRAAQLLAKSDDSRVRRSAVSRAYYAAYQAARGTHLSVSRRDEDGHEKLGKDIASIKSLPGGLGLVLTELRRWRNEFDYSPYPGPNPGALYNDKEIERIIRDSLRKAKGLVRAFESHVKRRD